MMKIELARTNELDRIKCIAESCAKDMIDNNIFQWNENYPSKDVFKDELLSQVYEVPIRFDESIGRVNYY